MTETPERTEPSIRSAITAYARCAPLDTLTAGRIQEDLLAILGKPHTHRANKSPGNDACFLCHRDLRHSVHTSRPKS